MGYLLAGGHPESERMAADQYYNATNMTDRMGGLSGLVNFRTDDTTSLALSDFYEQWQQDPLVVDKWFALQAAAPTTQVEQIRALIDRKSKRLNSSHSCATRMPVFA